MNADNLKEHCWVYAGGRLALTFSNTDILPKQLIRLTITLHCFDFLIAKVAKDKMMLIKITPLCFRYSAFFRHVNLE